MKQNINIQENSPHTKKKFTNRTHKIQQISEHTSVTRTRCSWPSKRLPRGDHTEGTPNPPPPPLYAADAQYHRGCLHRFESNAGPSQSETLDKDPAFTLVVDLMLVDKSRIWNTIEPEKTYNSYRGNILPKYLILYSKSGTERIKLITACSH